MKEHVVAGTEFLSLPVSKAAWRFPDKPAVSWLWLYNSLAVLDETCLAGCLPQIDFFFFYILSF